jgi:Polyketide cyclase / dehydrase and lipid transport.
LIETTKKLVTFLLLIAFLPVAAGEIQHASVMYERGVYTVDFVAQVTAGQPEIYRLITDHDHLHRLNGNILESALIDTPDETLKRRRVVMHVCILFFCRDVRLVEKLRENGVDEVIATVVPSQSDFRTGKTLWQVMPVTADKTRLRLQSKFQTVFWVPPVIGPWLIRKKIVQEMSQMINRLEQYAGGTEDA